MFRTTIIALLTLLGLSSCYNDNKEDLYQNFDAQDDCDTSVTVSYATDIAPILQSNCAISGCHSGNSPQSGLDLARYEDVRRIARNGNLVGRITATTGSVMPPTGSLPQSEIDLIESWVQAGACEN